MLRLSRFLSFQRFLIIFQIIDVLTVAIGGFRDLSNFNIFDYYGGMGRDFQKIFTIRKEKNFCLLKVS